MRLRFFLFVLLSSLLTASAGRAQQVDARASFRIKYTSGSALYLDAGQNGGLTKDMKLTVKRPDAKAPDGFQTIAEIQIVAVASTSAVCEIRGLASPSATVQVGDIAFLSAEDMQAVQVTGDGSSSRKFPQVVTFTEGDPLDEEQREYVPRPPLPEVNRGRGRIGFDYSGIQGQGGTTPSSYQLGLLVRADITRIGGTYWNFNSHWRGRLDSSTSATQPQTLIDVINRTYQVGFTYANPQTPWVAGIGRQYLPWAVSLGTIDGGYFGRRLSRKVVAGVFGGSTPDPAAWNYNPNRQLAGSFMNYETGSFDSARVTSTVGVAVTRINWNREREFAFTETGIFYKRYLSVYHSLQADMLPPAIAATTPGSSGGAPPPGSTSGSRSPGITQSFLTLRLQPHPRISFDVSHNYFRNPPTFDPRLVGTGLVENFLFEGLSGGVRVELPHGPGLYTTLGRSSRTGDARAALNQLYGIFLNNIWGTGIRADMHYSKFDSSFGRGSYEALSLSRQFHETVRWEVQGGQQNFVSTLTQQNRARWINNSLDWFVGRHSFVGAAYNFYRGGTMPYNQWFLISGYRF